ncbi:hypothetical protein [Cupriavidus gilardii]|uniref:hypothetical protein n=1 Tax=Cupriavidus gilardii TaxID=82541 RepID=UPI0021BF3128|nr:hypothetical protein [Cupriavidus gilardii]MCT9125895.1 hypothetical protein [Cupriavidus gilardii]
MSEDLPTTAAASASAGTAEKHTPMMQQRMSVARKRIPLGVAPKDTLETRIKSHITGSMSS